LEAAARVDPELTDAHQLLAAEYLIFRGHMKL